jgi:murein L,D-transpeptidase YafK
MFELRRKLSVFFVVFFCGFSLLSKAQKKQYPLRVDSVVVWKSARQMDVFFHHQKVKSYTIGLGNQPSGAKSYQGDGRTPEGNYSICSKNTRTNYHRALVISYPEVKDQIWASYRKTKPGGNIEIHGLPKGYSDKSYTNQAMNDWTAGCIAMKNADIEELYDKIKIPTPICILP